MNQLINPGQWQPEIREGFSENMGVGSNRTKKFEHVGFGCADVSDQPRELVLGGAPFVQRAQAIGKVLGTIAMPEELNHPRR